VIFHATSTRHPRVSHATADTSYLQFTPQIYVNPRSPRTLFVANHRNSHSTLYISPRHISWHFSWIFRYKITLANVPTTAQHIYLQIQLATRFSILDENPSDLFDRYLHIVANLQLAAQFEHKEKARHPLRRTKSAPDLRRRTTYGRLGYSARPRVPISDDTFADQYFERFVSPDLTPTNFPDFFDEPLTWHPYAIPPRHQHL
jgi:hypothetical protein